MSVVVHLPGPLRSLAEGQRRVALSGSPASVAEALELLWRQHPGLRPRVLTEQGEIRRHVNLFVGAENVRFSGGLSTPVTSGADLYILPAVSGGC